jgi:hypothetical protein
MLDRFIKQANDAHCPGPWPVPQHNCPIGATFSQQRLGKSVATFRRKIAAGGADVGIAAFAENCKVGRI